MKRSKPLQRGSSRMRRTRPATSAIRQSANGQRCTLQLPLICNDRPETVVLCHSNRLEDGKGMGLKAPDTEACYGCSACHDVLDGRRPRPSWLSMEELQQRFDLARRKTQEILKSMGLM